MQPEMVLVVIGALGVIKKGMDKYGERIPGSVFTAVKRKKLPHIRSFRALQFESVQKFTSAKLVWKQCRTCPGKPNFTLAKLVHDSHLISDKLSTFVCIFLCKIVAGTVHVSCLTAVKAQSTSMIFKRLLF